MTCLGVRKGEKSEVCGFAVTSLVSGNNTDSLENLSESRMSGSPTTKSDLTSGQSVLQKLHPFTTV